MSTLGELIKEQMIFDAQHGVNGRPWSAPITDANIPLLLELAVALAGEVGEFANITKKIARGDFSLDAAKSSLAAELADVFIYVLKLSGQLGIDLESEFRTKIARNEHRFERFLLEPNS